MTKQSGSAWLRQCRITELSPLGEQVADLLGDLFVGLYHLEGAASLDWANDHHIEVRVVHKDWASFDSNLLTKLIFLAHDRCLRVSLNPRSHHAMTLLFHQRKREGGVWERHPTIEQALEEHRKWYPIEQEALDV
jgi:hypothetical protein